MHDAVVDQLASAIAAFINSHANASGSLTERVARGFSAAYLLQMSKSLTFPEISTVLRAERARELGLTHARAGNLDEASRLIAEARIVSTDANLTNEALWAAESFQLAAESYLKYKCRRYGEARADLYGSIALSIRLGSERGYRMDYRVLHLARNLVHIENLLGSKTVALAQAKRLCAFISGDAAAWPFSEHLRWEHVVVLDNHERLLAYDDTIGEIALATAENDGLCLEFTEADFARMDSFLQGWLKAFQAYRLGAPTEFLRFAIEHCSACEVAMPQTRRIIRACLGRLCLRYEQKDLARMLEPVMHFDGRGN